jgi:hypothetical protein
MRNRLSFFAIIGVMVVAALACGSGVQVNPPGEQGQSETEPTSQPDVAPAGSNPVPTSKPEVGTARSNPAPAGAEVVVDDMGFVVTGSTRPATGMIMAANEFNTRPEAGQEYVTVDIRITCKKSPDEKCSLDSYNLKLLGSSGVQRDAEFMVAGVDGLLDFSTEFFGGATIEGAMPFIVNSDETDLLLVHSPLFGDPFYLAIQ